MLTLSPKKIAYACCPTRFHPIFDRIEASNIGYRLVRGSFWSIFGAVISRGLMLVASILVARILGKEVFGEYGIIRSTVNMFLIFAGFGLGLTATKYVAEFRDSDPVRAGRIIAISSLLAMVTGLLVAVGLLIFAPLLAEKTLNAPHLAGVLRIGGIILFINALNGAQTGALAGFEAFKTIAWVNLGVGLASFPLLVGGAYFGGLEGAVWALGLNMGINWLLNHIALRKEAKRFKVPFTFKGCIRECPILWQFSLPATLSGIMVGPANWVCHALLANQPDGYGHMGIFNATEQWYVMLLFLPSLFGRVLLPVLSEQLGNKNTKQSRRTLILVMKMNLFITAPLVVFASIASPYIMSLYGEGFGDGWPTLIVVLSTAGILTIQMPVGQIIAASGRMWIGFVMNAGWAMVFIISTLLLIDHGSLGLASARMISYIIHAIWTLGFAFLLLRKGYRNE